MTVGGAYADYAIADVNVVVPLPEHISNEEGASFYINPMTAIGMVRRSKELGATAIIMTAACSQLCRMIVKLCQKEEYNITPICVVRRQEQADILKEMGVKHIAISSAEDYKTTMGQMCKELKPTVTLEAIGGETTAQMMGFMAYNSTVILYGMLSEQDCSGISPLAFIGKNQRIEGFFLPAYMAPMTKEEKMAFVGDTITHYKTCLNTHINQRFGLDQVKEAIEFYKANQTAGKVVFKPELTGKN